MARRVLGPVQGKWITERELLDRLTDPETKRRHSQSHEPAAAHDAYGRPVVVPHRVVQQVNAGDSLAYTRIQQLQWWHAFDVKPGRLGHRMFRFKTDAELDADEQQVIALRAGDRATRVCLIDANGDEFWCLQSDRDHYSTLINAEIRHRRAENMKALLAGEPPPFNTPGSMPPT